MTRHAGQHGGKSRSVERGSAISGRAPVRELVPVNLVGSGVRSHEDVMLRVRSLTVQNQEPNCARGIRIPHRHRSAIHS